MTTENIYLNDLVQKQLANAKDYASQAAAQYVDAHAQGAFDRRWKFVTSPNCASPLEASFYIWWRAAEAARSLGVTYWPVLDLCPEFQIEIGRMKYRLDFKVTLKSEGMFQVVAGAIESGSIKEPLIAVELDGHEFHERTKEQVISRNQRDRDLQDRGWRVFHFSGSEFVARPLACVESVYRHAVDAYSDLFNQVSREG